MALVSSTNDIHIACRCRSHDPEHCRGGCNRPSDCLGTIGDDTLYCEHCIVRLQTVILAHLQSNYCHSRQFLRSIDADIDISRQTGSGPTRLKAIKDPLPNASAYGTASSAASAPKTATSGFRMLGTTAIHARYYLLAYSSLDWILTGPFTDKSLQSTPSHQGGLQAVLSGDWTPFCRTEKQ